METKNMIGGIVSLAVVVICVAAIMMPVFSEYTAAEKTYTNDGVPYVLMDDQEHTMVITNDGGEPVYTVDGVAVSAPEYLFDNQSTVIYGEDGILRVWKVSDTTRIRVQGADSINANLSDGDSVTVTFDSTNVTIGSSTAAIKPVAYLGNGTYAQLVNPAVLDDSTIYLGGLTAGVGGVTSQVIVLCGSGTIDNLTLTAPSYSVGDGVTITDIAYEVETTTLDGDLKRIDNIAVTFTMSDSTTHTANYTYFIAPSEVTYDNPDYLGAANSSLLGAVPVLVIVSLVVAALGVFITTRRD